MPLYHWTDELPSGLYGGSIPTQYAKPGKRTYTDQDLLPKRRDLIEEVKKQDAETFANLPPVRDEGAERLARAGAALRGIQSIPVSYKPGYETAHPEAFTPATGGFKEHLAPLAGAVLGGLVAGPPGAAVGGSLPYMLESAYSLPEKESIPEILTTGGTAALFEGSRLGSPLMGRAFGKLNEIIEEPAIRAAAAKAAARRMAGRFGIPGMNEPQLGGVASTIRHAAQEMPKALKKYLKGIYNAEELGKGGKFVSPSLQGLRDAGRIARMAGRKTGPLEVGPAGIVRPSMR